MGPMADEPESTNGPENEPDLYPVLPPDPERVQRPSQIGSIDLDELLEPEPPGRERFQFSLGEMLLLTLAVAVFLGLVSYLPGGHSLKNLAGVGGWLLIAGAIALQLLKPDRAIFYVAWSVAFVAYLIVCVIAIAVG
jgi:hypothetical protein